MRTILLAACLLLCFSVINTKSYSQIGMQLKINAPKLKGKKKDQDDKKEQEASDPTTSNQNTTPDQNNNTQEKTVDTPSTSKRMSVNEEKESLFSNMTNAHLTGTNRYQSVYYLQLLEDEVAKNAINYEDLKKYLNETEIWTEGLVKADPGINMTKYNDRYAPAKALAESELAKYAVVRKTEGKLPGVSPSEYFRDKDPFNANFSCHCIQYCEGKTYADYVSIVHEYDSVKATLRGYYNPYAQKYIDLMETCQKEKEASIEQICGAGFQKDVEQYALDNRKKDPNDVIRQCDEYGAALDRVANDKTIRFTDASRAKLVQARKRVKEVKAETEAFKLSPEYKAYLESVWDTKVANTRMPEAATKNATLEQGAINYLKSKEYAKLLYSYEGKVVSVSRVVTLTTQLEIKKNDFGIPLYKYHELCAAYKGSDGHCYMVSVYASYTYLGGGTYSSTPSWGNDSPKGIACQNINK